MGYEGRRYDLYRAVIRTSSSRDVVPVFIDDADGRFLKCDIEPDEVLHGPLLRRWPDSIVVRIRQFGAW